MSGPTFRKISSLHIYPVKSCRGIALQQMEFDDYGPLWDRSWMIVDKEGQFQTQRQISKMAQIICGLSKDFLTLEIASRKFMVPLSVEGAAKTKSVKVWKSDVVADLVGSLELDQALSDFLGKEVNLVRFGNQSQRQVIKKDINYGVGVRFADSASLLVTNTASLEDLNAQLTSPIGMERFRPNIVIEGLTPWEEDSWQTLSLGDLKLDLVYGCARCQVITQDQTTGESPSKDPLIKLSGFRRNAGGVMFGMNAVHRLGSLKSLKVGDSFEIQAG